MTVFKGTKFNLAFQPQTVPSSTFATDGASSSTYTTVSFDITENNPHSFAETRQAYWDMYYNDPAGGILLYASGLMLLAAGWITGYGYYLSLEILANFGTDAITGQTANGFPNPFI